MSLEFFWLVVNVLLSNFIVNYTVKSDKINRELREIYTGPKIITCHGLRETG